MFKDPEFRKALIIAIIVFILMDFLLMPLLRLSANGVMWLGQNVSEVFVREIYMDAAMGLREKYSYIEFSLILCLGVTTLVSGVTIAFARARGVFDEPKKQIIKKPPSKVKDISAMFLFATGICLALAVMQQSYAELQLISSFNQRLTVLAAHASDQQIKELRASWALMKSQSDYEKINGVMFEEAKTAKIELPPPLWQP